MTALWLWLTTSRAGRYAALILAAVAGVLGARSYWKGQGREDVLDKQQNDYIDRTAAGRAAGRDAQEAGRDMTGQQRLDAIQSNDQEWG